MCVVVLMSPACRRLRIKCGAAYIITSVANVRIQCGAAYIITSVAIAGCCCCYMFVLIAPLQERWGAGEDPV